MNRTDSITYKYFKDIDLNDPFFDSLKKDYSGFASWFNRKSNEKAYVLYGDDKKIQGFLYLKDENEVDTALNPNLPKMRRLKIGTFKVNAHGTIMGQKFLTIILRKMIYKRYNFTYVTILKTHSDLINLFLKWGFKQWGYKGKELVFYKNLVKSNNPYFNFPRISINHLHQKFLLGVYPTFHTDLFPDSKLNNEQDHVTKDIAYSNSIEKVYLTRMKKIPISNLKCGDLLVIYRTKAGNVPAEYSSVATSVCTLLELKNINDFPSLDRFLQYCRESIFTRKQLIDFYKFKKYPYVIKMLYNFPLNKRIIRRDLIEKVGLSRQAYYGWLKLSDGQFDKILRLGEVNEGFIID